jgi:hypothetical protein
LENGLEFRLQAVKLDYSNNRLKAELQTQTA